MGGSKLPMPFGNPATYAGHSGIDYAGHAGEPIPASGPGRVISRGRNERGGFFIWVQYDGVSSPVGYHHMNSHQGSPAAGTRVVLGQRLGFVGWTGHVVPAGRAGAHLHSEVSGHATTDGYWKFFDRNRVVGQGAASGGGAGKDDDMTPEQEKKLDETHAMLSQVIDYLGARGGMNTPKAETLGERIKSIGQQTQETRDYLGARGGMNTTTPNSLGFKIDALYKRWVSGG